MKDYNKAYKKFFDPKRLKKEFLIKKQQNYHSYIETEIKNEEEKIELKQNELIFLKLKYEEKIKRERNNQLEIRNELSNKTGINRNKIELDEVKDVEVITNNKDKELKEFEKFRTINYN